jgi:hypothetical protein
MQTQTQHTQEIEQKALTPVVVRHEGVDWTLYQIDDGDAYIRDIDWAERLGYANPIDIRKLIRRLANAGRLGVIATVAKTSNSGGRPATEFYLTEAQALKVAARSETEFADAVLDELIRVYMAFRAGQLRQVSSVERPSGADLSLKELMAIFDARAEVLMDLRMGELTKQLDTVKQVLGVRSSIVQRIQVLEEQVAETNRRGRSIDQRPPDRDGEVWLSSGQMAAALGLSRSSFYVLLEDHPALRLHQRPDGYCRWPLYAMAEACAGLSSEGVLNLPRRGDRYLDAVRRWLEDPGAPGKHHLAQGTVTTDFILREVMREQVTRVGQTRVGMALAASGFKRMRCRDKQGDRHYYYRPRN